MLKKICGIFSTILLVVLLALAAVLIVPKLMGYKEMAVLSGSMEPNIHVGAIVYVKEEPFESIKVGDVITYQLSGGTYVTHRVAEVNETEKAVITKGDANDDVDNSPVSATQIIGKAHFDIPLIGYISIYAKTPLGIGVICGVLIVIILLNFLPEIFAKEEAKEA